MFVYICQGLVTSPSRLHLLTEYILERPSIGIYDAVTVPYHVFKEISKRGKKSFRLLFSVTTWASETSPVFYFNIIFHAADLCEKKGNKWKDSPSYQNLRGKEMFTAWGFTGNANPSPPFLKKEKKLKRNFSQMITRSIKSARGVYFSLKPTSPAKGGLLGDERH